MSNDDRQAFEQFYRSTIRRVFPMVRRIVGGALEAEDVTQSAYLQGYRSFPNFNGRSSFFTWMYRVAMNVAIQHVRNRTRRDRSLKIVPVSDIPPTAASTSFDPAQELAKRELYLALRAGIDLLPGAQRALLVASAIQGRSYLEMSQGLGLSTAKTCRSDIGLPSVRRSA